MSVPGTSIVNENVWDNRYQYISELMRMGAHISVEGRLAIIEGGTPLTAAPVRATDLRAGAAMIVAALQVKGTTEISSIQYIERGYEDVVEVHWARTSRRYIIRAIRKKSSERNYEGLAICRPFISFGAILVWGLELIHRQTFPCETGIT